MPTELADFDFGARSGPIWQLRRGGQQVPTPRSIPASGRSGTSLRPLTSISASGARRRPTSLSEGVDLIELNVRGDNPARELYGRLGFAHAAQCLTHVIAGPPLARLADDAGDTRGLG